MSATITTLTVPATKARIGIVVIGRNEGERLVDCLASLAALVPNVVYVDSGSTDDSVVAARAAGAHVVELDMRQPFTAARARNEGLDVLRARNPLIDFVQFVDGDCSVQPSWIPVASRFLSDNPAVAAVCGRRRERHPETSVYNRLCDWEWDTPVGEARACGGDALMRVSAVVQVGGYSNEIVAAEDDDLCVRLRATGWKIWRLDEEMTVHDAAMTRFGQWWRRAVRSGHAFEQVGRRHGTHFRAERRRQWFWGFLLPACALAAAIAMPLLLVPILGLYLLSFARSAFRFRQRGTNLGDALACAGLLTLSKLPGMQGALIWIYRSLRGNRTRIIEYK